MSCVHTCRPRLTSAAIKDEGPGADSSRLELSAQRGLAAPTELGARLGQLLPSRRV